MEEKADKGSAFLFSLILRSNTCNIHAKGFKTDKENFNYFYKSIVKIFGIVKYSLYLCT